MIDNYKETELGKIPLNWNVKKIKDIAIILDNKRIPLNSDQRKNIKGTIPYFGANGIVDYIEDFIFDEEIILIAEDGGNFYDFENKSIAIYVNYKCWVNNHAHVIKSNTEINKFLFYLLEHKDLTKIVKGGTRAKLNQDDLKNILIPIPPIEEQEKIANILSKADENIENIDNLIIKTKELKKGLMQELLTKGIGHAEYKETEIGKIPVEWKVKKIKDVCIINTGKKNTQDKKELGEYDFYVRSDKIEKIDTYSFDGEAVLTAGDGVGTGKIIHYKNGKFDYHQRVYKMSNFRDISGKYFYYYFKQNFIKRISKMSAKNSVDSVRLEMISEMLIPIPLIEEQEKIANILSSVDNQIEEYKIKKVKLEKLKKGLMQNLLTGKMRVKV